MLTARLDHELASKGFSRKKTTWNRDQGMLVEVIDLQVNKVGEAVTMNVGILSRPIYFACWGRDADQFIEEPFCTVRARVGQLIDNKDRWWELRGEGVAEEMVDCIGARILPFLERMRSLEALRDWLASTGIPSSKRPLQSICFAALESELCGPTAACAVLAELESNAMGAWKARAREVAMRIGCAPRPGPNGSGSN
jgi:hypothetical protein